MCSSYTWGSFEQNSGVGAVCPLCAWCWVVRKNRVGEGCGWIGRWVGKNPGAGFRGGGGDWLGVGGVRKKGGWWGLGFGSSGGGV